MRKLLSANFARLWKFGFFWICMGFMLGYSLVYMLNGCRQALAMPEISFTLDQFYFHSALSVGAFCACLTSMFLSAEYGDGIVRNKIVTGALRRDIYLSNLVLVFTATLLLLGVWWIGALAAVPVLGVWKMRFSELLIYLLIAVLFTAAFSAFFTLVSMLCENNSAAGVVSLILFCGLLLLAALIDNSLSQPETISGYSVTIDGIQTVKPQSLPNPHYIHGQWRVILQYVLDFLPTGQGLQMWLLEIADTGQVIRMMLSSVLITVVTTICGILFFQKKDMK